MVPSSGNRLVACLARIEAMLGQNDAIAAAALLGDLNTAMEGLEPMSDTDLSQARRLLARCAELEQTMRRSTLESLQRLGASRRSRVYRHP